MKKLYKGKVHPSSPSPSPSITDRLSLLPATILTLTIALSPEDREVLVYLISCAGAGVASKTPSFSIACGGGSGGDHSTKSDCNCFRCYMSYWVRWDKSPNRELIHEILEVYEDWVFNQKKNKKKRNGKKGKRVFHALDSTEEMSGIDLTESKRVDLSRPDGGSGFPATALVPAMEEQDKTGPVRKIVNFIGEKIWGIWGV
ncbi:uncharacterized protein LOC124910355 [Impatiens glandulifera]|uniref:uncharacterized protein LOC124910355 n=1 Tax=Impatiens glandulifera TaxID=253017 RepID=UPI001FB05327|nr:uncharacterized protein LOC124910355 [Impatiens glandulifera]